MCCSTQARLLSPVLWPEPRWLRAAKQNSISLIFLLYSFHFIILPATSSCFPPVLFPICFSPLLFFFFCLYGVIPPAGSPFTSDLNWSPADTLSLMSRGKPLCNTPRYGSWNAWWALEWRRQLSSLRITSARQLRVQMEQKRNIIFVRVHVKLW